MTYYIYNREYYMDFHYLLGITNLTRSKLHFLLNSEKIEKIKYKNIYLYRLEDLYRSPKLSGYIEVNVLNIGGDWEDDKSHISHTFEHFKNNILTNDFHDSW